MCRADPRKRSPNHGRLEFRQWRIGLKPRYTLETIIVLLLVLWLLGAFIAPFGGDLVHLILVVVLVVVVVRLLQGQRVLE